jgi:hypothetical protein
MPPSPVNQLPHQDSPVVSGGSETPRRPVRGPCNTCARGLTERRPASPWICPGSSVASPSTTLSLPARGSAEEQLRPYDRRGLRTGGRTLRPRTAGARFRLPTFEAVLYSPVGGGEPPQRNAKHPIAFLSTMGMASTLQPCQPNCIWQGWTSRRGQPLHLRFLKRLLTNKLLHFSMSRSTIRRYRE